MAYQRNDPTRSYTNIPELTSSQIFTPPLPPQAHQYGGYQSPQSPTTTIRTKTPPAPIRTNIPYGSGFPLQFAAPPRTPTHAPQATSTFIPSANIDYAQAGFAAPPLTPLRSAPSAHSLHSLASKSNDNLYYHYYQPEPIPPVPQIQDIHVFNPSAKDNSLYAYNTEVNSEVARRKRKEAMSGYAQDPSQPQQQGIPLQNVAPGGPEYGQTMTFDPPPTQPLDRAPEQPQPMEYQPPAQFDNGASQPHAPGQIAHPNQIFGAQEYKYGFCSCFGDIGSCCLGCWCPCMLYSKTHHRLKTVPDSNLDAYGSCNGHCVLFCALAPVSWVFTMLQRTRIRELYQIKGSPIGDCAKSYYCPVCTLVQDEREIKEREDEKRRCAGPGSGVVGEQGYKKPEKMAYQRSSVIG
ncbi:hypothetical protein TWF225_007346 [Orbilia oligospora]|uniref:Uncharacterized protein n=1 Tax=Orbilia oligospora TaxID=2813651 RepID=A0A7C8P5M2_ORBOL|nr:hypothetical protein TWF594_007157 [Orbilia oligospora]KAF3163150.1 hypothetical protein TWF751_010424 [Orbilia oligospora]KAF3180177.1 hypothetical protein TWF225_007346 [Orbilia oligospora]KAF3249010.1 hypothetical protein TWF217_008988 [Orbilia oligospora]KAF3262102.1 hypothetical protein TWF128_002780 [Orbilia oligospora]